MTRVLDGLRAAPLLLSILYGCYGLYVLTRLRNILRYSSSKLLDTRKLLATSMFCVCFLRCLTFVTISLVNRRGDELVFHGSGNAAAIVVQVRLPSRALARIGPHTGPRYGGKKVEVLVDI